MIEVNNCSMFFEKIVGQGNRQTERKKEAKFIFKTTKKYLKEEKNKMWMYVSK